jgi:hypothetical protein
MSCCSAARARRDAANQSRILAEIEAQTRLEDRWASRDLKGIGDIGSTVSMSEKQLTKHVETKLREQEQEDQKRAADRKKAAKKAEWEAQWGAPPPDTSTSSAHAQQGTEPTEEPLPGEAAVALEEYEKLHDLPAKTVTLDQVAGSSAAVRGWKDELPDGAKDKSLLSLATSGHLTTPPI